MVTIPAPFVNVNTAHTNPSEFIQRENIIAIKDYLKKAPRNVGLNAALISSAANINEQTLFTYTIPEGAFLTPGLVCLINFSGTTANNDGLKTIRVAIEGVTRLTLPIIRGADGDWIAECKLLALTSATQRLIAFGLVNTEVIDYAGLGSDQNVAVEELALPATADIDISLTAQSAGGLAADNVLRFAEASYLYEPGVVL
jgi:hypothetical protein